MGCFKRLSASLHVKVVAEVIPGSQRSGFKRLSASLHVKGNEFGLIIVVTFQFQTPFGITACESAILRTSEIKGSRFKRLSASLHVKA